MGAPDPENPLFLGFSVLRGGLRPWSRKGPDHGVGVDPETVTDQKLLHCSNLYVMELISALHYIFYHEYFLVEIIFCFTLDYLDRNP